MRTAVSRSGIACEWQDLAEQRRLGGNMSSHVEQNVASLLAAVEYLIDSDGLQ